MDNLFEQATRAKLRFETPQGLLSVEDLWELPLTGNTSRANLDDIARGLHRHLKNADDEISFVKPAAPADELPKLQFEIVKHVIAVRVAERDAAQEAAKRRETKQRILELVARKEDEALAGKSLEELRAMAETL